jgi:hypothetical protein
VPTDSKQIVDNAVQLIWHDSRLVPYDSIDDVRVEPLAERHLLTQGLWSQPTNLLPSPAKIARSSILSLNESFENLHPGIISKVEVILGLIDARMRELDTNYKDEIICRRNQLCKNEWFANGINLKGIRLRRRRRGSWII